MEGSNNKLTILVVILLVLAFFAYMFFFRDTSVDSTGLTTESEAGITEEISTLLGTLQGIKLQGGIFSDPTFISLTNYKLDVIPFPAGRANPFAPIGL